MNRKTLVKRQWTFDCRYGTWSYPIPVFLLTGFFGLFSIADGDEIKLRRGGSFEATVVKSPEDNNGNYEFRLSNGAVIQVAKREVDSIVSPQSTEANYQAELSNHDLSTVEGHLEMVEWCQKQNLRIQKVKHLRRVVEIDPDNEQARRLLGYTRHIVTGKWVLRDEYYQSIGYVRDGTTMRLPQAQKVEQEEKNHKAAVIEWKGKIPRLITLLRNQRKFAEAKEELESIDDVKAIPVLVDTYEKLSRKKQISDFDRQVKSMLMGILAKFDILSAKLFLVNVALNEPDDVMQEDAKQILQKKHAKWTAEYLISRLNRIPPTSTGLIPDREAIAIRNFIGRAATILQELNTDTDEAILPLINLISINRVLLPLAQPKKGGLGGASFDSNGGVGMSQGSKKPEPRPVTIRIEPARVALIKMTEQRFDYDKKSWLNWYLSNTLPTKIDLRRLD